MKFQTILILLIISVLYQCQSRLDGNRKVISLNGTWEIAESLGEDPDGITFKGEVPVPGLADLADPPLDSVGYNIDSRKFVWYKREFTLPDPYPEIVRLKLYKAKYGARIWINGSEAGIHMPSFTPYEPDIEKLLNPPGESNNLLIRLGAHKDVLPDTVADGFDFEKVKYIPGIYDDVEIIMANSPLIESVQVNPDINNSLIEIQSLIINRENLDDINVEYIIREWKSKEEVKRMKFNITSSGTDSETMFQQIQIENPTLWTPENPFLYELEVVTEGDREKVRFGMRDFRLDPETGRAILNGKPYYMRGTNVCVFRFMEDDTRGTLVWDPDWVRKLHQQFKSMHWNSIRYCIGFPPEIWYDIADEEGLLIQDEFPIWYGTRMDELAPELKAQHIAGEYVEWMKERWNHPCVVIWDAQNETVSEELGIAIEMVRDLDLSERPWDNGWSPPMSEYDVNETHPYLFTKYFREKSGNQGPLAELISEKMIPENGPDERSPSKDGERYRAAIIINEYGWLWLNRDYSFTSLTKLTYPNAFPNENLEDIDRRRILNNMTVAGLTEYWRAHRTSAGVLHFCGLGYSRHNPPYGQTSDNFINIPNLEFDPYFIEYVKPAFSPVGVMIDNWNRFMKAGEILEVPVHVINDLYEPYTGDVLLKISKGDEVMASIKKEITVEPLGKTVEIMIIELPEDFGDYFMIAELLHNDELIKSTREIIVK
ncbi:glycoside hydrolase family 2 TIM barrel-domain containing protein [Bacteroidota bacterium]